MFIVDNVLMSGNIYGEGLNKKQGVNEEKEQFIVILMVVSVLHNTVHTCVRNWSMIKLSGPVTYFYSFSYWHSSCNLHAHTLLITLFEEILRKSHYILNYILIYLYIDVSLWNLLNVKFVVCEIEFVCVLFMFNLIIKIVSCIMMLYKSHWGSMPWLHLTFVEWSVLVRTRLYC